jgi:hypothetical protein
MAIIQQNNIVWQPRPLNLTGDLQGWRLKMYNLCPNPKVGQVVYLESTGYDRAEGRTINNLIGYLCLNIRSNGEGVWERGQTIEVASLEA